MANINNYNHQFSLNNICDVFWPYLNGKIKKFGIEADILTNYPTDRLELVVSYNGEANISILISRFELENNSIGQWTYLIHDRINKAITKIMPPSNNAFVTEYEEIMQAQDIIDKIQT